MSTFQILRQLSQANQQNVSEIVNHAVDIDQSLNGEPSSRLFHFDKFYEDGGSTPIKSMCNFTGLECHEICMSLSDHVSIT